MPPKHPEPKPTIRKKGRVEKVEVRTRTHGLEWAPFPWQVYQALAENSSRVFFLSAGPFSLESDRQVLPFCGELVAFAVGSTHGTPGSIQAPS